MAITVYQTYTNSDADEFVWRCHWGITKVFKFWYWGHYTYAKLILTREANPDFKPISTPQNIRWKASSGNTELFKTLDSMLHGAGVTPICGSFFGDGQVPGYNVVDAQINYRVPKFLKSTFKLGATTLPGRVFCCFWHRTYWIHVLCFLDHQQSIKT